MVTDFVARLIAMFVVDPFQAELESMIKAAGAPVEVVQQVRACAVDAPPILYRKAADDMWWATQTVITVGIGWRSVEDVVAETGPSCATAVAMMRPFLQERGG
jgi:hypothetical protein